MVLGALLIYCCCVPGLKAFKSCCFGAAIDDPLEDGNSGADPVPTVCAVVQHDRVNALAVLADAKVCTPNIDKDIEEDDAAVLKAVLLSSMEEHLEGAEEEKHGCGRGVTAVGHAVAEDVEDAESYSDEEYAATQEWREAYAAARLPPAVWGPW